MLLTFANILYVLVATAMIVLILLQRGAGASAGSGFGGGASATVFGARGSANFLSKSTAVLATLFFVISMSMAMYASRSASIGPVTDDLGVMGALQPAAEVPVAPIDAAPVSTEVPTAPSDEVPVDASATAAPADAAVEPVESEADSAKSE
jgi:preprotein translocase subunit SecG